ncbi:MAG TPA: hypothetical protein VHF25_11595, partial [Nitriliruptorales bacterium]|nr:hypothetical protein [Nitriliruptorales bacterium]
IGDVSVLGLDETSFVRLGPWRQRIWSTSIVGDGRLLDVVEAATPCRRAAGWPHAPPTGWTGSAG